MGLGRSRKSVREKSIENVYKFAKKIVQSESFHVSMAENLLAWILISVRETLQDLDKILFELNWLQLIKMFLIVEKVKNNFN
jgi:hypothetical protein